MLLGHLITVLVGVLDLDDVGLDRGETTNFIQWGPRRKRLNKKKESKVKLFQKFSKRKTWQDLNLDYHYRHVFLQVKLELKV